MLLSAVSRWIKDNAVTIRAKQWVQKRTFQPRKKCTAVFFPPQQLFSCANFTFQHTCIKKKKKNVAKTSDAKETKSQCNKKKRIPRKSKKKKNYNRLKLTNANASKYYIQFRKCHISNCNSSSKYSAFTTCYINYQITSFVQ